MPGLHCDARWRAERVNCAEFATCACNARIAPDRGALKGHEGFQTKLLAALMTALLITPVSAQTPPPIDLGIQNILQETPVWCWAAVAQQIILASNGPAGTPPQCGLVAIASGVSPQMCCRVPTPCARGGHLQEIQGLILRFGGRFSAIALPADPMAVYRTLVSGRAIVMSVRSTPFSGHVIVIRGMAWIITPMGIQPVLYVNDPLSFFTQPIPFIDLLPYWQAAIIVH